MGLKTALRGPLALFAPVSTAPATGLAENSIRQATPRRARALVRFERRFHTASVGKSRPRNWTHIRSVDVGPTGRFIFGQGLPESDLSGCVSQLKKRGGTTAPWI